MVSDTFAFSSIVFNIVALRLAMIGLAFVPEILQVAHVHANTGSKNPNWLEQEFSKEFPV